jgi:hypothetical protein
MGFGQSGREGACPFSMNPATESRLCAESSDSEELPAIPAATSNILNWLPAIEWCILAILVGGFIGLALLPGWRSLRSEFPNYYLAAELYHQGIPLDRVYEWTWFQRQNDHLGVRNGLVSFAPNPPSSILPLLPLTRLKPLAAKRAWIVSNLVLLALSLFALRRTTQLGWRRLILITLLCTLPLRVDFLLARYYVLILFLICVAYYASCRNKHWAAGVAWSAAAAMKLFPAISVILFIRKRNWRALTGFLLGATTLAAISVALFGAEVHQVFVREVLTQASRGDWLGPYSLYQNSFITLWSHFFLIEPELNPFPLVDSPLLYSTMLAVTVTVLVFVFLRSIAVEESPQATALHWAALVPLLLLLSTTTAVDYSCLLIFTTIVASDVLLAMGKGKRAMTLLLLYVVACAPIPDKISHWFPVSRLAATTGIYGLLIHSIAASTRKLPATLWFTLGLIFAAVLTLYNFEAVRNRAEDFRGRVSTPGNGYRYANPVPIAGGIAFTEMEPSTYAVGILTRGVVSDIPMSGDALSITASAASGVLYAEQAGRTSTVVRFPSAWPSASSEALVEGQEPALSANGKWLAFIRVEQGIGSVELLASDSHESPRTILSAAYHPLDITVTDEGDVIAASGNVSDPHMLLIRHETGDVSELRELGGSVRYPSISPDGKRLAFSRRNRGSWSLFVRTLATGEEQQLTHALCNATSPSWVNLRTLLYATDCGRGVGLSALARVAVPN